MSLFQPSVVKRHLRKLDKEKLETAWQKFTAHFHNPAIQANIRKAKEEQYQEGFLRDLFVNVLGYTLNPDENFNLTTELKNIKNAKKADGAILKDKYALAVIELKGMNIVSLNKAEEQAFGYKNNQPKCVYVITSNFGKLRFYIDNAVDFEEFNLFQLTKERFEVLYLCLCAKNLLKNLPKRMKEESVTAEEDITKKLYADYSLFRKMLFENIVLNNPTYDKLTLFKKTQKLLDRFLFIFFAEDTGLVAPNTTRTILKQWADLRMIYDAYAPLYQRFQKYFGYLNEGYNGRTFQVFAYNGGLFEPDDILDSLEVNDEALYEHTFKLSKYDFASEVSVNILGHIFEHSLTEIEEIQAELAGQKPDKNKSKRKKDGVFYTPSYITKYIIDNTVGKLCKEKKAELGILETEEESITENSIDLESIKTYRKWLLNLTICDPACGSGAFLNQALEFLIAEHEYIDELQAAALGETVASSEIENAILENNLFGVDINQESVEIAKLSLWLRTAKEGRKLTFLNENIKCGNSLIDDAEVAGDSAFVWEKEFPQVFENGGFDIVVGNPPYVKTHLISETIKIYLWNKYHTFVAKSNLYSCFMEKGLLLIKEDGVFSLIVPNTWTSLESFEKIRKYILNNSKIVLLTQLPKKVFEDATVETCIFCIEKKFTAEKPIIMDNEIIVQSLDKNTEVQILKTFKQNEILNTHLHNFQLYGNTKNKMLIDKLSSLHKLINFIEFKYGFKTGDDKMFLSNVKLSDEYKPFLRSKYIKRYGKKEVLEYVYYNPEAMRKNKKSARPGEVDRFESEKIIVARMNKSLISTYDSGGLYVKDAMLLMKRENISLLYILGLLNSKLINYYYREFFITIDVLKNALLSLPVVKINFLIEKQGSLYNGIIEKADKMLLLHNDFQKQKKTLLKMLQADFELTKLSKKLQHWYELSPAEFLKELQKKKIKLGLRKKAEWLAYFEEEKAVVGKILQQIAQTDKEIDNMVYELYGLTKEEIKIVEEAV